MVDFIDKLKKSGQRKAAPSGKTGRKSMGTPAISNGVDEVGQTRFHEILHGVADDEAEKRLGKILNDIKTLSDMLSKKRLLEDLEDYRAKVGEFLRFYMDEVLDVRQASGRRGFSRRKQLLVVKKVNVEIEELTKLVLGGAKDFEIMKELGTIEGLLMDLYR